MVYGTHWQCLAWYMAWPGVHGMVYGMALWAWHGILSGISGIAYGIWYGLLGLECYMVCSDRHTIV